MIFVFWANLATKNRVFLILYKKEYFLDQSVKKYSVLGESHCGICSATLHVNVVFCTRQGPSAVPDSSSV